MGSFFEIQLESVLSARKLIYIYLSGTAFKYYTNLEIS